MNTINPTNITFRSTIVPMNTKRPLLDYMNALKNCNLKSMQNMSVEQCYKSLHNCAVNSKEYYTGVILENGYMRFLGNNIGNDKYVFHQLKKLDKNVSYSNDIPLNM